MNKKVFKILFAVVLSLLFMNVANAKNAKSYGDISIDKDAAVVDEFGIVRIYVGEIANSLAEAIGLQDTVPVNFYTTTSDLAYINKDLWWETIYLCNAVDLGFGTLGADESAAIFTDSMASFIEGDKSAFLGLFGENQKCETLEVKDVADDKKISFCKKYSDLHAQITKITKDYQKSKNIAYKTEYNKKLDYLKSSCKNASSSASYNDACIKRCLFLRDDIAIWDKIMNPNKTNGQCGFSHRLLWWIKNILNWIKYIIPVIIIILSILDFIKSIGADKDDEMKKAQGKFTKRLIAAALVFLIPLIIVFVLDKMGFTEYINGCGIMDI